MRFDIITIFPEFFSGPLDYGIVRRAREAGLTEVRVHDLRNWTHDRHRTVDDRPFGGGEGMVLKPEPIFEAVESLLGASDEKNKTAVILLSASGKMFRQADARRFAQLERVVLLCGRYEGVDERVAEHLATDEMSIGDFVLSGGELPAAMIVDAVTRLLPGALGNEDSSVYESFSHEVTLVSGAHPVGDSDDFSAIGIDLGHPLTRMLSEAASRAGYPAGLLDCPHYTRPAEFRDWGVPEVLMSGNHEQIRCWRRKMALAKTLRTRPELLAGVALSEEDMELLDELRRDWPM